MSAVDRVEALGRRLAQPVILRYDARDAQQGHEDVRVDCGRGVWVVAIDRPGTGRQRDLDGLGAGETIREAVSNAQRALERRLSEAEHRARAEGDPP